MPRPSSRPLLRRRLPARAQTFRPTACHPFQRCIPRRPAEGPSIPPPLHTRRASVGRLPWPSRGFCAPTLRGHAYPQCTVHSPALGAPWRLALARGGGAPRAPHPAPPPGKPPLFSPAYSTTVSRIPRGGPSASSPLSPPGLADRLAGAAKMPLPSRGTSLQGTPPRGKSATPRSCSPHPRPYP